MPTHGSELEPGYHYQLLFDPITGLPNGALLLDRLTLALARARRSGRFVGLLAISISFASLGSNQTTIHALSDISTRLTSLLRPDDTAARVAEACAFVVVCNELTAQDHLDRIADRLAAELSVPFDPDFGVIDIHVTANLVGVFDDEPAELLDAAARVAVAH